MAARGYDRELAERVFRQIEGFGSYGFPESHAASFAHLVYVSSWLKCFEPAAFFCARTEVECDALRVDSTLDPGAHPCDGV